MLVFGPKLPYAYAGVFNADGSTGLISETFASDIYHYSTTNGLIAFNSTLPGFDTGCNGLCVITVQGFGFNIDCTESVGDTFDVNKTAASANTFNSMSSSGESFNMDSTSIFGVMATSLAAGVDFTESDDNSVSYPYDTIHLSSSCSTTIGNDVPAGASADTCIAQTNSRSCFLRPCIINYPIQITNRSTNGHSVNGIKLVMRPGYVLQTTELGEDSSVIENGQIWGMQVGESVDDTKNLASIGSIMSRMFEGGASLEYTEQTGYVANPGPGPLSAWLLNHIMLRASISAAYTSGATVTEGLQGTLSVETIIYESDYGFMAAAVSVMILCIVCVLPTYYGFWELGRRVTLGPVEIASVFQAPALQHPSIVGGGKVNMLLRELGQRKVRYGEVEGKGKLGVDHQQAVKRIDATRPGPVAINMENMGSHSEDGWRKI